MKTSQLLVTFGASLTVFLIGCGAPHDGPRTAGSKPQPTDHADHAEQTDKAEQAANIASLSAEDRALAEAQGYCAVTSEPLGSMGPPLKLMVNDQPAFICCKGCEKKAQSNPDKTLASVEALKARVIAESER
ncbi:MAG: hypothetical protein EHM42_14865 [Planctomycetaceae bacterium]|nr:MAG: hypothetical protein EHM42_14865 [Planctomycetaceae bacterium]